MLPFQGEWVNFAAWELTRFPSAEQPEGSYNQLGLNTMLGERVWHCQRQFRVEIGIEQAEDMLRFLPDGEDYQPLCELVRMYVGIELRFDIGFRVPTVVIPECQLTLDQPMPPRLGWNSWLGQPVGKMVVNDVHFPALD